MKKKIDELDLTILRYLNKGARNSLKKLAEKMNQKTSTMYHRLTRLISNNVILGFTMVFNPELLKPHKITMIKMKIKPLNIINTLDDMLISSFAKFLEEEYENALFIAYNEKDRIINMITVIFNEEEFKDIINSLKKNAYIEDIQYETFSKIKKGYHLLGFNEKWIDPKNLKIKEEIPQTIDEFGRNKESIKEDIGKIRFGEDDNIDDITEIRF